jgi:hypothetical protein
VAGKDSGVESEKAERGDKQVMRRQKYNGFKVMSGIVGGKNSHESGDFFI